MSSEFLQATSTFAAALSALTAVFSGTCAVLSYRLARSIQNELKSDERLIVGTASHPALLERSHAQCVLQCPIFNKSKRKAYIESLSVYDRGNRKVAVTWSAEIDDLGNPQHPSDLVGIIDSTSLYIRRNDGESFDYARVLYSHSFSQTRGTIIFDPSAVFVRSVVEEARA